VQASFFLFLSHFQGVPFRTSHDIAGKSVALCTLKNCQLLDLSLDELRSINPVFEEDVYDFLGVENAIQKFVSYGSTGSACVASQIEYWMKKLEMEWRLFWLSWYLFSTCVMESQSQKLGIITHAKDPATRNFGIYQDDSFEYLKCM